MRLTQRVVVPLRASEHNDSVRELHSLEPDVLGSRSEFKILAGETSIDPRTSGELCIERAMSR